MSYQEDFNIAQRYDLLCRASQSSVEQDGQRLQLAADLDVLDKIINHNLPELARSGSPDHFADILKNLNLELEHFREFCEFQDLAQKVVVGVGGAFSAGKSSLINTLLGKKRLVVEIDPTTSLPTYLLHGEQEQITALNLFRRRVTLSQDEFASLTHEEKIKYGSQIAGLLRSAFICDPDFAWKNIALLDTPGYSKPDSEQWSERTDESVARSQLNLSNFIIWVVSATQGTISEDDLKFLATLNADIPKLIVVSRADAKVPEDIAKIVALVKQTTVERSINVLDVVPVSARKKNDYPVQPIVEFLENWNNENKKLNFVYNFRKLFTEYSRYMQDKQKQAKVKLDQINQMIFLSDNEKILEHAYKLQGIEQDNISNWQASVEDYDDLQTKFFDLIHNISKQLSSHTEQFIDLHTVLSNTNCSTETLLKYAKVVDDELLQIIYHHPNCPISLLEDLIDKPIGSLSFEMIEMLLEHKNIRENNQRIYEHLDMVDVNLLPRKLRLNVALSPFIGEKTQLSLAQRDFILLKKNLAMNPSLSENIQHKLAEDNHLWVRVNLVKNPNCFNTTMLKLIQDEWSNVRCEIAQEPCINENLQSKLAGDSFGLVRQYLAKNPNLIETLQVKLADDRDIDVREELASHHKLCAEAQKVLLENLNENITLKLLENPNLCAEVQISLCQKGSLDDQKAIKLIFNPNLCEQFQESFYKFIEEEVVDDTETQVGTLEETLNDIPRITKKLQSVLLRDKVWKEDYIKSIDMLWESGSKNTLKDWLCNLKGEPFSLAMQQKLLNDSESTVRRYLASQKKLDDYIQNQLTQDNDVFVRRNLAENPNINEDTQLKLLQDEDFLVKINVAGNSYLSETLQLKIMQDSSLRSSLARNSNIDLNIILELTQESNINIRRDLVEYHDLDDFILLKFLEEDNSLKSRVIERDNLSETIQLKLIDLDEHSLIKNKLAQKSCISEAAQLRLAQDEDGWVRHYLASNLCISEKTQLKLAQDENGWIKDTLFQNPNLSVKVEQLLT